MRHWAVWRIQTWMHTGKPCNTHGCGKNFILFGTSAQFVHLTLHIAFRNRAAFCMEYFNWLRVEDQKRYRSTVLQFVVIFKNFTEDFSSFLLVTVHCDGAYSSFIMDCFQALFMQVWTSKVIFLLWSLETKISSDSLRNMVLRTDVEDFFLDVLVFYFQV
jgi:hypothetical protein